MSKVGTNRADDRSGSRRASRSLPEFPGDRGGFAEIFRGSQSPGSDLLAPWGDALLVFHGVAKAFHLNSQLTERIDSH